MHNGQKIILQIVFTLLMPEHEFWCSVSRWNWHGINRLKQTCLDVISAEVTLWTSSTIFICAMKTIFQETTSFSFLMIVSRQSECSKWTEQSDVRSFGQSERFLFERSREKMFQNNGKFQKISNSNSNKIRLKATQNWQQTTHNFLSSGSKLEFGFFLTKETNWNRKIMALNIDGIDKLNELVISFFKDKLFVCCNQHPNVKQGSCSCVRRWEMLLPTLPSQETQIQNNKFEHIFGISKCSVCLSLFGPVVWSLF